MKMPSSSSATFSMIRNTHLTCATELTQLASCWATPSAVISQASAPVAPITSITVALVMKAFSSKAGTCRQVMSRYRYIEMSRP